MASQDEIPKLRTLSQCEEVLGQAGLVPDSKVFRVYAHGTTIGARGARVFPNEPGVVRAPAMEELADGSNFVALSMGQWTLSHEEKLSVKAGYEFCGVLRPGFDVTLDLQKARKPSSRITANPIACPQAR